MKTFVYSVISLLAGTCIGTYLADNHRLYRTTSTPHSDTVTLLRIDTMLLRDTLRIPIPTYHETVASRTITITVRDTDSIALQAVSRVYADSTFRAVVSGIDPRLDSLTLFRTIPTVTHTLTNHITTTRSTPRWGLGITAGATASSHGLTPGITIGLTYRLWP